MNAINWDEVDDVRGGKAVVQLELVRLLLEEMENSSGGVLSHFSLSLGLMPDDDHRVEDLAYLNVQEKFLKNLEHAEQISNLRLSEKTVFLGGEPGFPQEMWSADFDARRVALTPYLKEAETQLVAEVQRSRKNQNPISLSGQVIRFDDDRGVISIGDDACSLPLHKNEHCLCRVMFRTAIGVPVQAADLYKEMTGDDLESVRDKKAGLRKVKDAVYATVNRVALEMNTQDELFTWSDRLVIRNF